MQPPSAEEFAEAPRTVLDDRAFGDLEPAPEPGIEPGVEPAPEPGPGLVPGVTGGPADPATGAESADPIHALPTQQISVRRASSTMSRLSASASATSSPVEAMKLDEVARTRVFLQTVFVLCAGGIIVALSTAGDHVAKVVVLVGSVGAALGALVVIGLTRDPARYEPARLVVPALLIVFGSMSGVYYWGAGSPVAAMLVYGIYFFSLGADRRITTAMYALVAATHGVLGIGIMTGVLADHGVVRIDQLRTREQLAIVCIV